MHPENNPIIASLLELEFFLSAIPHLSLLPQAPLKVEARTEILFL